MVPQKDFMKAMLVVKNSLEVSHQSVYKTLRKV